MLQDDQLHKALVVVLDGPHDVIRKRMTARGRANDKPEIIDRRIRDFRDEASLSSGWAGQTSVERGTPMLRERKFRRRSWRVLKTRGRNKRLLNNPVHTIASSRRAGWS